MTAGKLPPVLVVYNAPGSSGCNFLESDAAIMWQVRAVAEALSRLKVSHRIESVRSLSDLRVMLGSASDPVVFNLVESLADGVEDICAVPTICRAFGKGCTGNDTRAMMLSLDKWQCKAALQAEGLPTPAGVIVPVGSAVEPAALPAGPYIVKPARTDASEGIDEKSVIGIAKAAPDAANFSELSQAVGRVHDRFAQPAIVEQFIDGRELHVGIVQIGGQVRALPPAEVNFSASKAGQAKIFDYATKWLVGSFSYENTTFVCPAVLEPPFADRLRQFALAAWRALGCQDYARVDFRLDSKGKAYILEVNTNPDLSPEAGFVEALKAARIDCDLFIAALLENAVARRAESQNLPRATGEQKNTGEPTSLGMRRTEADDRDAILKLLAETAFFRDDELAVARELLDDSLARGDESEYRSYTALLAGRPIGWVCFGPTPCAIGTYDVYWIAVDSAFQGKGVGAALMNLAEGLIAAQGGRIVVVETSSRQVYDPTRKFYLKLGYYQAAEIPDFYASGDGKIIYTKKLK